MNNFYTPETDFELQQRLELETQSLIESVSISNCTEPSLEELESNEELPW